MALTKAERGAKVREMEEKIVRSAAKGLIEAGYLIQLDNGEEDPEPPTADVDAALKSFRACDEEQLRAYRGTRNVGSILLIYGESGWDVMCDWHTNLDPALKETEKLVDELSAEWDRLVR